MATTPRLGLVKIEVGQASKETTINANYDIIDIATSGGATGAIWARAFHSATQSLTTATLTAISLNSERWDTNVIHDNSTNNTRLTCKTAGVYLMAATLGYAANATGARSTQIRLNGTTFIGGISSAAAPATVNTRHTICTMYLLAVNDYVELMAYQESGGALNTEQLASATPEFMMIRLGA